MAAKLNNESLPCTEDRDAALDQCICIFKCAKTDNERFAALLLVTRVSNDIDSSQRKRLFDAIGFTFINRLLKTKAVSEGSLYQVLAVTILACFATDEELLFHPQMVAKIPLLNQVIAGSNSDDIIADDAYQILVRYSSSTEGCKVLLQQQTVPCMVDVVVNETSKLPMAWEVLLNIVSLVSVDVWSIHTKPLVHLVTHCASKLRILQGSDKFTYCTNLLCLLSHTADTAAFRNGVESEHKWIADLCSGLGDILQGKVTSTQRDPALVLISVVIDLLGSGIKWVFTFCTTDMPTSHTKADFFTLVVTSVCIEIRMILDESAAPEMIKKSTVLTSCYNILESVIAHLITMNEEETEEVQRHQIPQAIVTKLYSQITEAMMSVLNFLQQEAVKFEEEVIAKEEEELMFASVRVVCAWLAEESMALQKEVNKVLPFLITLARYTMAANQHDTTEVQRVKRCTKPTQCTGDPPQLTHGVEILRFMLPALCHLSANEKSRKILIENAMLEILVKYYFVLCEAPASTDCKTALLTLLGVLLNFAVTEPNLIEKEGPFHDLQTHVILNVPNMARSTGNMDMLAHQVILCLMLLTHQKESLDLCDSKLLSFFESAVIFFKEASKLYSTESAVWSSISELWFLGVQVITQEFSDCNGQLAKTLSPDVLLDLASLSTSLSQL